MRVLTLLWAGREILALAADAVGRCAGTPLCLGHGFLAGQWGSAGCAGRAERRAVPWGRGALCGLIHSRDFLAGSIFSCDGLKMSKPFQNRRSSRIAAASLERLQRARALRSQWRHRACPQPSAGGCTLQIWSLLLRRALAGCSPELWLAVARGARRWQGMRGSALPGPCCSTELTDLQRASGHAVTPQLCGRGKRPLLLRSGRAGLLALLAAAVVLGVCS